MSNFADQKVLTVLKLTFIQSSKPDKHLKAKTLNNDIRLTDHVEK